MKTGRNETCPCGSGKKYKKCCLTKDQVAAPSQTFMSSQRPVVASCARCGFDGRESEQTWRDKRSDARDRKTRTSVAARPNHRTC